VWSIHVPLTQANCWLHVGSGFVPYSHARPLSGQVVLLPGGETGHAGPLPPSVPGEPSCPGELSCPGDPSVPPSSIGDERLPPHPSSITPDTPKIRLRSTFMPSPFARRVPAP